MTFAKPLMETARHGRGERVFLVDFVFVPQPGSPHSRG